MLKQTLLSIMLVAASAASPLVNRQGAGVVGTSTTASQEVASAITSFSDDVNAISAAITALETETDTATIAVIANNAFITESDVNSHRQVLFRFAGDAGNNANQKITTFAPQVSSGFQAIINDPSPQTANSQAQQISAIR
jgi:hypothetical protein